MYPTRRRRCKRGRCFPRTRGDVPVIWLGSEANSTFPPHTRGCTWNMGIVDHKSTVSPAHAGMYRRTWSRIRRIPCFPRTRGDVPVIPDGYDVTSMFPPHTRGCTLDDRLLIKYRPVSPAHAGMYRMVVRLRPGHPGFPRTRGDVPFIEDQGFDTKGFPPHTRRCTLMWDLPRCDW